MKFLRTVSVNASPMCGHFKLAVQFVATLAVISMLATGALFAQSQTAFSKLIWSDEFDIPGKPDSSKWGYDIGNGCPKHCGWGNNELQYYTNRSENVGVRDGVLYINGQREDYQQARFTSARLTSKGRFQLKYGRVEVRARIPEGVGTWPAIWMLGANIDKVGWPACGEIDIMEHKGSEVNRIFGTLHYPGHSGDNANGNSKIIEKVTKEFSVYAAEWTAEKIEISVNGNVVHSVSNHPGIPYNHDFYLLLNLAIGGGFAGPVDEAFKAASFEIDYIRVYQ